MDNLNFSNVVPAKQCRAIRLTKENREAVIEWVSGEAHKLNDDIWVPQNDGSWVVAQFGDWIVEQKEGNPEVLSSMDFHTYYRRVDDRNRLI